MGAAAASADRRIDPDLGRLHLAGTGTFAFEIIEYARAAGYDATGLIELIDRDRIGSVIHGLPVIGPEASTDGCRRAALACGGERTQLWSQLAAHGWAPVTIIHPSAAVSPSSEIGPGALIAPLVVIGAAAQVGAQTLVGRGCTIGHHVTIGSGVSINPGANVGGRTVIGERVRVGIGATLLDGLRIGAGAQVAAGSVVVRDVAEDVRVQGVPARVYDRNGATA